MYELSTVCQILSKGVLAVVVHGSKSHRPIYAKEPRFLTSTPNAKFSLRDLGCAALSRYPLLTQKSHYTRVKTQLFSYFVSGVTCYQEQEDENPKQKKGSW